MSQLEAILLFTTVLFLVMALIEGCRSEKLRGDLGKAREALDDLLHESQSLRADLRELEDQDIEVEMDLSAFDDDDDFDDSEEWKQR